MLEKHLLQIVQELSLQPRQVAATAVLLEEGATVPFIARYRKERTGELDEVQIANIRDRLQELEELDNFAEVLFGFFLAGDIRKSHAGFIRREHAGAAFAE